MLTETQPWGTFTLGNYHVFFGGSMQQSFAYDFPPGVALRMPAQASLDMNVHYVNRTASTLAGEAFANLYTVPVAQVQHVAKTLNLANTTIVLPAGKYEIISRQNPAYASPTGKGGKVEGIMTIDQPEQFWEASPFLIIVRA